MELIKCIESNYPFDILPPGKIIFPLGVLFYHDFHSIFNVNLFGIDKSDLVIFNILFEVIYGFHILIIIILKSLKKKIFGFLCINYQLIM